ncbi:hypothetical protein SGLAM104S_00510 [Streptomyces glaucescens]
MAAFLPVGGDLVAAVGPRGDAFDGCAGAHLGAVPSQVGGQRIPQRGREGGAGHVEQQAFGGPEEVDVEHQRHLRRGQVPGVGEEAPGEHLERQMTGAAGEAHGVQEVVRADAVEAFVHLGDADVEQRQRSDRVHGAQVPQAERGAERDEAERAPRRGARDVPEAVAQAAAVQQWIVRQGGEPFQPRIRTTQQPPQVVVLAEERVEATAHGHRAAVPQPGRPSADPPAQVRLPFVQRDGHPAFGQRGRGGQPGDTAPDHGGGGAGAVGPPGARPGGQHAGPAVPAPARDPGAGRRSAAQRASSRPASARRATNVWVMPVCQPGRGRARTRSKPAVRRRSAKRSAVSNSRTLCHRWR